MKAVTRLFGEIDIQEDKIITLENGMIGLPEYQKFALIFDEEKETIKVNEIYVLETDKDGLVKAYKDKGRALAELFYYYASVAVAYS